MGTDDQNPTGATTEFFVMRPTREPAPEVELRIEGEAVKGRGLLVVSADARESLGELTTAEVELATPDPTFDPDELLGEVLTVEIARGPRVRRVRGVVRRAERIETWGDLRRMRLSLVSSLWMLSLRSDCRIFQDLTAIEVVRAVLAAAGVPAQVLVEELQRTYARREYCVQYRETDLAFVLRLLEDEGVALYFRHDETDGLDRAVITDGPTWKLTPTLDRRAIPFSPPQSALGPVEVVQRFEVSRSLCATGVTLRDYDFTRPLAELDLRPSHPRDVGAFERYDHPADFTLGPFDSGSHAYAGHDGHRRAESRDREERATERVGRGVSNVTGMMPGRVFELFGHEHSELDRRYLLTAVTHRARAPEVLLTAGREAPMAMGADRYRNEFECVVAEAAYAPPRRTPRPRAPVTQTAVVTGRQGEEIEVDAHGRIKVQFHWDRLGRRDAKSSCWIRTSQLWAGAGWGAQFIPRVGMEVVVTFLEGNVDRPLVTGCVYNAVNTPPYALPDEKTRSGIRSQSSPGGDGSNELRFEDRAGAEEVYLHAQRDLSIVVEHDSSTVVGNNQTRQVRGNQSVQVIGDYAIDAKNFTLKASDAVSISGKTIEVTASDWITLTVGGASITIADGEILIDAAALVKISSAALVDIDGTASVMVDGGTVKLNCE